MTAREDFQAKPTSGTVTVALGEQLSTAFPLYGTTLVAFETPSAVTGTSYTFFGSIDKGVTYTQIRSELGAALNYTGVAASGAYPLDPRIFVAFDSIKINTGTNEAAERIIKLKAVPV